MYVDCTTGDPARVEALASRLAKEGIRYVEAALAKAEKMVSGDYAPESRIRQHLKDVRTMLAASPLELPLTRAHERLLEDAVSAGDGDLDNAAIIRRWQARSAP